VRQLNCIRCGAEFSCKSTRGRYCSRACLQRASYQRRKVKGVCSSCSNPARPDYTTCEDCASRYRQWSRYYRSGFTPDRVSQLLDSQEGRCAICLEPFSETPHADHSHKLGIKRGLLCHDCNVGIGLLNDSPATLLSAAHYLLTYHSRTGEYARTSCKIGNCA
jgi:hypothetical protein